MVYNWVVNRVAVPERLPSFCMFGKYSEESNMSNIPFQAIDWNTIATTEHKGDTGMALWRTIQHPGLRIRIVEYSKGYLANHWCEKGHIVHCLEGAFSSELQTGEVFQLSAGMSYVVSDDLSSHRSFTEEGVKLLIIDGDFLQLDPGVK
jgi:hypothetical protein